MTNAPETPSTPAEQAGLLQAAARRATALVRLRFVKEWQGQTGGYVPGDVAFFDADTARSLIARGIASDDAAPPPVPAPAGPSAAQGGSVLVRFRQPYLMYSAGESAGFDAATAQWLQAKGFAECEAPPTPLRRTLASIRDAVLRR